MSTDLTHPRVLGMLSLVKDSPRDPRANEWLGAADDSAQHLQRLIDDIIDLSKLEAGTLTLLTAPVDLSALLREVLALLHPLAAAKGLSLRLDIDPALPARLPPRSMPGVVSTASRTSPACCARGAPTSSASTAGTRSSPSTSPAPS